MSAELKKRVQDQLRVLALNEIYWPSKAPSVVDDHEALYDIAAARIGQDRDLLYLEFGVASGNSLLGIARRFDCPFARFVGFDSFMGLPEAWLHLPKGYFSTDGGTPTASDARIGFVKGWFQDTLHHFLSETQIRWNGPVLVHFDADLYSSTLFLLTSLWPHFQEYYFIMDDFIHEDAIALYHFSLAFPVELGFYAQTRGGGDRPNPDSVFGHMRRVPFRLR